MSLHTRKQGRRSKNTCITSRGSVPLYSNIFQQFSMHHSNVIPVYSSSYYLSFQWENHSRSIKLEAVTFETIKNRITVRQNSIAWVTAYLCLLSVLGEGERFSGNLDWLAIPLWRCQAPGKVQVLISLFKINSKDTWFISWNFLRYTLQYTYPYAYYIEPCPRKELVCIENYDIVQKVAERFGEDFHVLFQFEYQQAQLEAEIENLSWKVTSSIFGLYLYFLWCASLSGGFSWNFVSGGACRDYRQRRLGKSVSCWSHFQHWTKLQKMFKYCVILADF